MASIWIGLLSGIVFGFVIQRIGATNPHRMARAHLMLEPDIPMFMLLAVLFSAWGLWGLEAVGAASTMVLPVSVVATLVAAILFGVGWGLAGYCPGTCWAAVGEGRMDAVFALLGGLCGTALFAHFHEWVIPPVYESTSVGPVTLPDWLGSSLAGVLALSALFGGGAWLVGRFWRGSPHV
jgi:hypothetical protein